MTGWGRIPPDAALLLSRGWAGFGEQGLNAMRRDGETKGQHRICVVMYASESHNVQSERVDGYNFSTMDMHFR